MKTSLLIICLLLAGCHKSNCDCGHDHGSITSHDTEILVSFNHKSKPYLRKYSVPRYNPPQFMVIPHHHIHCLPHKHK